MERINRLSWSMRFTKVFSNISTYGFSQCVMLVDYYATLFFVEIGNICPEEFCRKVNLCEGSTYISLPRSNSTCVFCHHLVEEVLEKLKDPDSQVLLFHFLDYFYLNQHIFFYLLLNIKILDIVE